MEAQSPTSSGGNIESRAGDVVLVAQGVGRLSTGRRRLLLPVQVTLPEGLLPLFSMGSKACGCKKARQKAGLPAGLPALPDECFRQSSIYLDEPAGDLRRALLRAQRAGQIGDARLERGNRNVGLRKGAEKQGE